MVISADIFAVLLRYFQSSIGNLIITVCITFLLEFEAAYFFSQMSKRVSVKYILLCNSFVLRCIEPIFAMEVLWDDKH